MQNSDFLRVKSVNAQSLDENFLLHSWLWFAPMLNGLDFKWESIVGLDSLYKESVRFSVESNLHLYQFANLSVSFKQLIWCGSLTVSYSLRVWLFVYLLKQLDLIASFGESLFVSLSCWTVGLDLLILVGV